MAMDPESEYCLRWKKYELNFRTFFADLFQNEALVDVSLVTSEGTITSAHKIVLSACSPYFQVIQPECLFGLNQFVKSVFVHW